MISGIFFKIVWDEENMGRISKRGRGRTGHGLMVVEAGLWVYGDSTYCSVCCVYSKFSTIKF